MDCDVALLVRASESPRSAQVTENSSDFMFIFRVTQLGC